MALYEYRPVPQPVPSEVTVALTFANDTLVSVGTSGHTPPRTWVGRLLDRLFPDDQYDDPYGQARVQDCVEALGDHEIVETSTATSFRVSFRGRSC